MADNPAPANTNPAPIPSALTPIIANAPASPRIAGTSDDNTAPETPNITNIPASDDKPFTIEVQLIAPNIDKTGVNTANAVAATNKAAEPERVPVIRLSPTDNSTSATPIVVSPRPISPHCI